MSALVFAPVDLSTATQVGRKTWRKQILPIGSINYQGTRKDFDLPYLKKLTEAFNAGAYDQVPVVFADGQNAHNEDPRNYAGEVKALELADDGLYGVIEFSDDGAKAVQANPRLGVSARIREMLQKADGRSFGAALRHVLLTMDPKVTGMQPWKPVDLSDYPNEHVLDLSEFTFGEETEEETMGDTRSDVDLAELTDDEFIQLLDLAGGDEPEPEDDEDDEDEDEGDEDDLQAVLNDMENDPNLEDGDTGTTNLSTSYNDESAEQLRRMQVDLAEQRWENERTKYIDQGVPPFLLDLATPVMTSPDAAVLDLADGDTVNATEVVRKMLQSVAGIVPVNGELGHNVNLSDPNVDPEQALLEAWNREYGSH